MDNKGEIVIYQTQDGTTQLDVRLDGETVWITQEQMAQLFQRDRTAIGRHIANIFSEGELDRNVVCANFAHTTLHGANYSEACDAESKADFVHKLTIAQKEAHETIYWLKVLYGSKLISKAKYEELMADVDELHKMLSSSIKALKSEDK